MRNDGPVCVFQDFSLTRVACSGRATALKRLRFLDAVQGLVVTRVLASTNVSERSLRQPC